MLSYMPISALVLGKDNESTSVLLCLNGNVKTDMPWNQIKTIIDKVDGHVCGHASLTDMRLLLERNSLWPDAFANYVHQHIESCVSCRSTAPPQPAERSRYLHYPGI